jgi:DNA-binding MarR family transcriptional regulator
LSENGKLIFQFFNEIGIIHQLSTAIFQAQMPDGLHVSHFAVLNHLVRVKDGVTPLAIANAFQSTKGNITNSITQLSKRGLVRVAPHETDGRSKVVFLTDEGRAFRQEAIASLMPAIAAFDDKINWEDLLPLIPKLETLRKTLDGNRDL